MDVRTSSNMPSAWDPPDLLSAPVQEGSAYRLDEPPSRKHRTPNHVKSKPANPAVISSIIDSLDTLSPSVASAGKRHSGVSSRRSRNSSPHGAAIPASISFSRPRPSPGRVTAPSYMNSSHPPPPPAAAADDDDFYDADEYDEYDDDAALPPTIPTARGASGIAHYAPPQSPSYNFTSQDGYLGEPSHTRRSSFSSVGAPEGSKKKLSSESWVKKSQGGEDKLEDARADPARGRPMRKSLRRKSSQEMLRPLASEIFAEPSEEKTSEALADQIIARTPPQASTPRGRLYLRDSSLVEDRLRPAFLAQRTSIDPIDSAGETEDLGEEPEDKFELRRISTLKAPMTISDSIPTRTSSLRQASSSPVSRRSREKRAKRLAAGPSKEGKIPESSWADLGEDDETVKRILELREQRKSRLQEEMSVYEPPPDIPLPGLPSNSAKADAADPSRVMNRPRYSSIPDSDSTDRPYSTVTLASAADTYPLYNAVSNGTDGTRVTLVPNLPDVSPWSFHHVEAKRPYSSHNRPTTAKSEVMPTPSLSLDYSYADAVDVLHSLNNELQESRDGQSGRDPTKRLSLFQRGGDGQSPLLPIPQIRPTSRRSKKSFNHHDGDEKKGRRKSIGDARNNKNADDDDLVRKKDIEDAVSKFLHAPRLSRLSQNPQTGRRVAYSEVGDPNGAAVFVCVGMGLTRYVTAFYDDLATTLRLRLITVDRPGVGGSEPRQSSDKSGPLGWPNDVLAICQQLGITKFSLLAHSAGAVYALATALILPHMVNGKVHLLAPWIPPSQLEAIAHPTSSAPPAGALPRGQRLLRVLPTPFLKAANSSFMAASSASLKPTKQRKVTQPSTSRKSDSPPNFPLRDRPASAEAARPDVSRRESLMLMDQDMPATYALEGMPMPPVSDQLISAANHRRGSLGLSATANPTDPGLSLAATALNAAEHAERTRAVLYTQRLTEATWDLATRDSNPATDLLVCLERSRDVGFRYTDVARAVVITHGVDDKRVPLANVRWLAEQMNRHAATAANAAAESSVAASRRAAVASGPTSGLVTPTEGGEMAVGLVPPESRDGWADAGAAKGGCVVRALSGEGHGLMANPVIMGDILTEIAGYWTEYGMY